MEMLPASYLYGTICLYVCVYSSLYCRNKEVSTAQDIVLSTSLDSYNASFKDISQLSWYFLFVCPSMLGGLLTFHECCLDLQTVFSSLSNSIFIQECLCYSRQQCKGTNSLESPLTVLSWPELASQQAMEPSDMIQF